MDSKIDPTKMIFWKFGVQNPNFKYKNQIFIILHHYTYYYYLELLQKIITKCGKYKKQWHDYHISFHRKEHKECIASQ